MQNHSGEHVLSGLIHQNFGFNNAGFHLSDTEPVTGDTDGVLSPNQAAFLEEQANAVIYADLPVTDSYPSREELASMTYRSKIEILSQVRIITIGDSEQTIDVCACCAPHVPRTGAIGIIKILSAEKFRGGTRLSILCGRRAFEYLSRSMEFLDKASKVFSTRPELLPSIAEKMKEENIRLTNEAGTLTEQLLLKDINAGICKNAVCTEMALSPVSMKNLYNTLTRLREGFCGIFSGNDEDGYRYYAGGKDLDAGILAGKMREELAAKGGGSAEMIQGKTTASRKEIEAFFEKVKDLCKLI